MRVVHRHLRKALQAVTVMAARQLCRHTYHTSDACSSTIHPARQAARTEAVLCFCLQSVLGEGALVVLEGQRVVSSKAQDAGFTFKYKSLQDALNSSR